MSKRILSLILAALLALAAFVPAGAAGDTPEENAFYIYTENGKALNVRSEPGGEIVGTIAYGTKVEILSFINENWAMISFRYDKAGSGTGDWPAYINRRYLIDVEPEAVEKAIAEEKETYSGDPEADIRAEFRSAVSVEHYRITVRPARVTSWVNLRWVPSESGMIITQYKAGDELTVLKELDHYLQVMDPFTGDVGFIHKKYAAR